MENKMAKIKVSELDGIDLDLWTAKAKGQDVVVHIAAFETRIVAHRIGAKPFKVDWNFVGPIVVRDELIKKLTIEHYNYGWDQGKTDGVKNYDLVYFKRLIVKRKYGEEIDTDEN